MRKQRLYLDHNATAPLLPEARDAMMDALALPGNPSSVHADGREARAMVDRARRQVASLVNGEPAHVTFTSGASEAAAHVLTPDFRMGRSAIRVGHLYHSAIEHPCVLEGGRFASSMRSSLPVKPSGLLDLDALRQALEAHDRADGVAMVAVMLANNESGVVQPIAKIAELVHAAGGILVVDAVQAVTRMPVDMAALGADFLILSAHKIGGPKGVGALISSGEMLMPSPLIPGGGQEKGHRAGTENLSGIVGFGTAAHIGRDRLDEHADRLAMLQRRLEEGMKAVADDVDIVSSSVPRLVNTTFFAMPGLKAETGQIGFDLEGISVSAGSACSSGKVGESHVLAAMGRDATLGALRVSTGFDTREEDIDRFLDAFTMIASRRQKAAAA